MISRKEAIVIAYETEAGKAKPVIAVLRDSCSSHFVLYRLVEMCGDDIEAALNTEGGIAHALHSAAAKDEPGS